MKKKKTKDRQNIQTYIILHDFSAKANAVEEKSGGLQSPG